MTSTRPRKTARSGAAPVANNALSITGFDEVSAKIGAATCHGGPTELVVATHAIHSFNPT